MLGLGVALLLTDKAPYLINLDTANVQVLHIPVMYFLTAVGYGIDGEELEPELDPIVGARAPEIRDLKKAKVPLMEGERIVFAEESGPQQYLRIVASGEIDTYFVGALDDYVRRQKGRLGVNDGNGKKEETKSG